MTQLVDVSDEDLFIRPSCASSIVTLPEYLGRHLNDSDSAYHPLGKSELGSSANGGTRQCVSAGQDFCPISCKTNPTCKLICCPVCTHLRNHTVALTFFDADTRRSKHHFVRSIFRLTEISTAPLHDRMDESTFLEYLPMLCQMSMHERAAEHAFQQVCASDPEAAAAMSGRRRTTRRSGNTPSRTHYFVTSGLVQRELGSNRHWCGTCSACLVIHCRYR